MQPLPGGTGREDLRRTWLVAWQKARLRQPLTALEAMLADVLQLHPEYQDLLADPDVLTLDWTPEGAQTNPFLHMGLHVALAEGIAADRPAGLRAEYERLRRSQDRHDADHLLLECLAETLWQAERAGLPPDESEFLARARRVPG